jgi:3-deoxy-7-phosphoheptulonate synthase
MQNKITIIAGPCAIESEAQLDECAAFLSSLGVKYLRGGAFKPRTNPDDFQGLGTEGLEIMVRVAKKYGMKTVSEIMDTRDLPLFADIDILQVGSRNMHNTPLLKELGRQKKPVLLKRGHAATLDEFLQAARYIEKEGNTNILLCERGVRTFMDETRFTLNLGSIPAIKEKSKYPLIVDPSHAAGKKEYVIPMAKGALAAGADGLILEIHPNPEKALSDSAQALTFKMFEEFIHSL